MFSYTRALVRGLPASFLDSLKMEQPESPIDIKLAHGQHEKYTALLKSLLPTVIQVPVDNSLPDCVFIEDTAIVLGSTVIIMIPGAKSRQPETKDVRETFMKIGGLNVLEMDKDARCDGGDVLTWKSHVFVGLSSRTNQAGVDFIAAAAKPLGFTVHGIQVPAGLHLKSAVSILGDRTLLAAQNDAGRIISERIVSAVHGLDVLFVPDAVSSNVLRIGEHVVIQHGFPASEAVIRSFAAEHNLKVHTLEMSEFIKADGALTCCNILF